MIPIKAKAVARRLFAVLAVAVLATLGFTGVARASSVFGTDVMGTVQTPFGPASVLYTIAAKSTPPPDTWKMKLGPGPLTPQTTNLSGSVVCLTVFPPNDARTVNLVQQSDSPFIPPGLVVVARHIDNTPITDDQFGAILAAPPSTCPPLPPLATSPVLGNFVVSP